MSQIFLFWSPDPWVYQPGNSKCMNPVKHVSLGPTRRFDPFVLFVVKALKRGRRDHHKHQKHGTLNSKVGDGTFTLFKKSGFHLRNLLNLWILFCFLGWQSMQPELKSADVTDVADFFLWSPDPWVCQRGNSKCMNPVKHVSRRFDPFVLFVVKALKRGRRNHHKS